MAGGGDYFFHGMALKTAAAVGAAGLGLGTEGSGRGTAGSPDALTPLLVVVALVSVAAVVAYGLYLGGGGDDGGGDQLPDGTGTGEQAPTFSLTDIDGNAVSLGSLRGKVVVLDLFATWCGPCQSQMAELSEVRGRFSASDVVILSIDVDTRETASQAREFKAEYGATWAFAMDTDGVGDKYGASSIPTLAIVDRDGNLAYRNQGLEDASALIARIEPLLAA